MGSKLAKDDAQTLWTNCSKDSDCLKDETGTYKEGIAFGIKYCCMYTKLITIAVQNDVQTNANSFGWPTKLDYYSMTCSSRYQYLF